MPLMGSGIWTLRHLLLPLFENVKEAWPCCWNYVTGSRLLEFIASPHLWFCLHLKMRSLSFLPPSPYLPIIWNHIPLDLACWSTTYPTYQIKIKWWAGAMSWPLTTLVALAADHLYLQLQRIWHPILNPTGPRFADGTYTYMLKDTYILLNNLVKKKATNKK